MINITDPNTTLVIYGTTASGKSQIALDLAKQIGGIIINGDSVQVYKNAPILSNIPTQTDQKEIPHKLFSFLDISTNFSVGQWLILAKNEIEKTISSGKIPIIVGGSGLYISSLINGISEIPSSSTAKAKSIELFNQIGQDKFLALMESIDPEFCLRFQDKQRLMRAYEVFLHSGEKMSFWQKKPKQKIISTNFVNIFVQKDRNILAQNVATRTEHMLKNGSIEEVKSIMDLPNYDSLITKILGAYEISLYLQQSLSLKEATNLIVTKTMQYAKKQKTWFTHQLNHSIILDNSQQNTDLSKYIKKN